MKAAIFVEKGSIQMKDTEIPCPKEDEVLVKVKACGICGTDQHIYHGQPGSAEVVPLIVLGHELAGEVEAVGSNVTNYRVGDRVTIDPNIYCGECDYCRGGRKHLCDHLEAVGVTRNGGMGEYTTVPEANCYNLPDSLSYVEGAMIEPLGCVVHGIEQLKVQEGFSVLIIGGGFIGQLMLQALDTSCSSSITVSEPDEGKQQTLKEFGATQVINPLKDGLNPEGYDIVVECVGRKETMQQAVSSAKKGGQILLFGVASPDTEITVSPFEIFSKELTINGSFINPDTHEKSITLIETGKINIKPLISHTFKLEDVPEIMQNYGQLKVSKGVILM